MAAVTEGPAFEQVVAVHKRCRAYALVLAYRDGDGWFDIAEIGAMIGTPITERAGAATLAKLGLAMLQRAGGRVRLRAEDPRAARFINEARLGPQLRGFGTRAVVEAVLHLRAPTRRRVNLADDRRLSAAETLSTESAIDCDDLLGERMRVRLRSKWTLDGSPAPSHRPCFPLRP